MTDKLKFNDNLFENCDVILVLQNGELVQMGSHEELMAQSGYYKTVWDEQNEI